MKLYATVTSERGKPEGVGGNEYLDIDIKVGNSYLARLTVRKDDEGIFRLYDEDDAEIKCREPQSVKEKDEKATAKKRLEYLRKELRAERISYGELAELKGLVKYIEAGDVELLEAAGVPEFEEIKGEKHKCVTLEEQRACVYGKGEKEKGDCEFTGCHQPKENELHAYCKYHQ